MTCPRWNLSAIRATRAKPAIYATQDPLWTLFFTVLDRDGLEGMINNGAIWLKGDDGAVLRRYYYCISVVSLRRGPWKPGAVYLLPGDKFEPDPTQDGTRIGAYTLIATHWLCRTAV